MMQASFTKQDGTPLLVFGLSYENLQALIDEGPIVIDFGKLGHSGKMGLVGIDGCVAKVPREDVPSIHLSRGTLESLKAGKCIHFGAKSNGFTGEIVIFSAPDERTMEEMFSTMIPEGQQSETCPVCRKGFREDGSCSCKETMQ